MENKVFNVCLCTDDNYAVHCAVTLCSLFENNRNDNFKIHILINSLSDGNKQGLIKICNKYNAKIEFHKVNSILLEGCQYRTKRPLSEAAYYRVLLSSILPKDIKKVLYLDCDIVVTGSINDLFFIEMNNYPIAAVQEPVEICEEHRLQLSIPYGGSYFNSGVLLINLNYWRDNNVEPKLLEFSKRKRHVFCHDQDALNYVFKGIWYRLPPKWNKSNTATLELIDFYHILDKKEYLKDARIIHYIDEPKPWYKVYGTRYRRLYEKYRNILEWKQSVVITKKNRMFMYKRAWVSRLKGVFYYMGILPLLKNIKIILSNR